AGPSRAPPPPRAPLPARPATASPAASRSQSACVPQSAPASERGRSTRSPRCARETRRGSPLRTHAECRPPSSLFPPTRLLDSTQAAQADDHDGDREEARIHRAVMLPADEQPPDVAEPREAPFHLIPTSILLHARDDGASPLGSPPRWAPLGRDAH